MSGFLRVRGMGGCSLAVRGRLEEAEEGERAGVWSKVHGDRDADRQW